MGTSDKALKIFTIAVFASVAAYAGYRVYKKRYPFEDSKTKSPPPNPNQSISKLFYIYVCNLSLEEQDILSKKVC